MATRKALVLVSGLFQELNSSSDKLDFAGNSTSDLSEGTNEYFTQARARGSVSVASGNGLTYNSSTGVLGTSAIPNSQLANDDVTIGNTAIALGGSNTNIGGLNSITTSTLNIGSAGATGHILLNSGNITFEGSTADANETILTAADATGGDKTLTLPNETGTILSTATSIANSNLANSSVTIGSTQVNLGATVTTFAGLSSLTSTTLVGTTLISGSADAANSIKIASGNIVFEGSSANDFETTLTVTNPTADRTITLPDAAGTVVLLGSLSVAAGSGLTYNSGTGQFGTSSIPNAQLANSTVTVGSTAVALGASATTFTGLASITSTAVVTNDSGFRVRNNSDNTKILALDCSSISGSTTRTLVVPDSNGTIATQAYVQAQITAEDLDITTDSGTIAIDLDSETLQLSGGTGIDTSASGNTVTVAVDSTIATESFATAIAVALG